MKPTPKGWPRLATTVFYDDAGRAIDWLVGAFDFRIRLRVPGPNGTVAHAELEYGDDDAGVALVMIATLSGRPGREHCSAPAGAGGKNTQSVMLYVDDVDAHCARARAAGARIVMEPTVADYGPEYWADKNYEAVDPEGHHWYFAERVRG